jgi:hypothetical protein
MKNKILIPLLGLTLSGCASDFYYENGKKVEVLKIESNEIQKKKVNEDAVKYYKTSTGHKIGVKNDILVECNEKIDCREVLAKYETVSLNALTDTIFLVKISKDKNVFEFSQKLYEDTDIKIAHPNFRKEKRRR